MKRKTVAVLTAPKLSPGGDVAGFGTLTKRVVVLLTVWAMAVAGVLGSGVMLSGSASAAATKPDTTAPKSVTALAATVVSNTSIKLTWVNPTALDFTGVTIRRLVGAKAPTLKTGTLVTDTAKAAISYTDIALAAGTTYSYAVFAHDGVPNYSAAANVTATTTNIPPDTTPPGPVTVLTATAASTTSIALSWVNPSAADFTGVTVRRALGAIAPATVLSGTSVPVPASATATSYTDIALVDSTQYSYAVFAHDATGNNAAAANATATTLTPPDVTPPGPVTALTATAPSTTSIKLDWANPSATDFTGVTIRRALGPIAPATATSGTLVTDTAKAATSYTDTALAESTQYSYAAFAHDGSGNYAAAANATATTLTPPDVTPPGPVTGLTATAASTTSIDLSWVNPTAADFTGVTIRRALGAIAPATETAGTSVPVPASATATSYTDTGLAVGTQYSYSVFAHDGIPNYATATKATATTLPDVTPPGPVTNLAISAVSIGNTFLSISWTNPTDPDLTGVMIRRLEGAIAPAGITDGVLVRDFNDRADYVVDAGLTAGTQYSYAVFAHDGSGNYSAGVNVTGTTTGIAPHLVPPGPVTTLTAAVVSDTSVKLDWVNPTDADFAGVTIRRAEGPIAPTSVTTGTAVTVPASPTATSFTDTALTPGTQYSYAVFTYDVAKNIGVATNVTVTTTKNTTALLVTDTRATVATEIFFDPAGSYAATGATVTSGTLDYGDGTAVEAFTGDPVGWYSFHTYAAAGSKTVTLTVIDSAGLTVTKVVTVNIYDPPTAAIPATGDARVGVPFTFPLTATTPAGTTFQSWSLYGDLLAGGYGTAPPATLTHTFNAPGTYTFTLTATNDAGGEAISAPMVVTVLP